MTDLRPLVVDAVTGTQRQMQRGEAIDDAIETDAGAGRLALALVRQLVLELSEQGIELSPILTKQINLIDEGS